MVPVVDLGVESETFVSSGYFVDAPHSGVGNADGELNARTFAVSPPRSCSRGTEKKVNEKINEKAAKRLLYEKSALKPCSSDCTTRDRLDDRGSETRGTLTCNLRLFLRGTRQHRNP